MNIAALMTCHNRQEKTLSCLDALFRSGLPQTASLAVFLVDDGSTDGTSEQVRVHYPEVQVIQGDGNLFWNGGMRVAFTAALAVGFDYYLWLNDDTLLYPSALMALLNTAEELQQKRGATAIVVGSTHDAVSGRLTYGGVIRPRKCKATTFSLVQPSDVVVECETMNGNCVLIPGDVARVVGGMEPGFVHSMGDLDYGLRARSAGFSVWLMPGFAGSCSHNPAPDPAANAGLSVAARLRKIRHPKVLPMAAWRIFTQRHAGALWPLFWLWPYCKVVLQGIRGK